MGRQSCLSLLLSGYPKYVETRVDCPDEAGVMYLLDTFVFPGPGCRNYILAIFKVDLGWRLSRFNGQYGCSEPCDAGQS